MSFAKTIEMSSESKKGFHDAVEQGVKRATTTLENVRSVWLKDEEVIVENGAISAYRAHLKATFVMKE
jgi:hypothetical protein